MSFAALAAQGKQMASPRIRNDPSRAKPDPYANTKLSELRRRIVDVIGLYGTATRSQIIAELDCTEAEYKNSMETLVRHGEIVFRRPSNRGYWELMK